MTKSMKMSEETAKPGPCEAPERVSAHTQEQLQLHKTWSAHTFQCSGAHKSVCVMDRRSLPIQAVAIATYYGILHTIEQPITHLIYHKDSTQEKESNKNCQSKYNGPHTDSTTGNLTIAKH